MRSRGDCNSTMASTPILRPRAVEAGGISARQPTYETMLSAGLREVKARTIDGYNHRMREFIFAAGLLLAASAAAQTAEDRLFEALDAGKQLVAEGILVRGGVNLDARNAGRETPLHVAIEKGYRELVELMVKARAPLAARTLNGETPLHFAALHSDSFFVDLLLSAKADPNARNNDGESVLQWAVMSGNPMTAKHLLEGGADPMAVDLMGNTLLHAAADGGQADMASAFLSLGVDPRRRNRAGKRPIDIARALKDPETVKLLERFEKD